MAFQFCREVPGVTGPVGQKARAGRWVLVLVLLIPGGCKRTEERAAEAKATPPASTIGEAGMNVLLVSVDTTRADHLGCYGHPEIRTPNVDRIAAEGTRFAQCITSAPLTLPSHSTMLTGSYPFVHGARDNGVFQLDKENVTLAEVLKQAGYATHAEVAAMVLNHRYGLNQGFDTYGDTSPQAPGLVRERQLAKSEADLGMDDIPEPRFETDIPEIYIERTAENITWRGVELLAEKAKAGQPFFMFLHYFDPHWPHQAPERFASQYEESYYAEIAFFDEQFGKLIDAVRELGLSRRTLVILTSDHGEGRGQHAELTHSMFLYDTTLRVPLIMWCPGQVPAGQVVRSQVRLVDLAPTILDFVKLADRRTPQMQGNSLLPLMKDPAHDDDRPCYSDTFAPHTNHGYSILRSLRSDGWKYILAPSPELYHMADDPLELINLVKAEPQRAAAMREQLWDTVADSPAPPANRAVRQVIDEEELQKLQALGYLSGGSPGHDEDSSMQGSELDHFEPVGLNPRDHIEEIELLAIGMGANRAGKYEYAEAALRRLLQLDPKSQSALSTLGAVLVAQEREEEGIEAFRRAIELRPDDGKVRLALASMLGKRGEFTEAEEHFRRVIADDPTMYAAHYMLGRVLGNTKRAEEAFLEYAAAIELAPPGRKAGILTERGQWHHILGQLEDAITDFTEAVRLDPRMLEAHSGLAVTLRKLHRTEEAIAHLQAIIKVMPDEAVLQDELGRCYLDQGDASKAHGFFVRVVELLPQSPNARRNLGINLLMLDRETDAIEQFREVLKLSPDDVGALYRLASTLQTVGATEDALRTVERLVEAAPDFAPGYLLGADLLERKGDPASAIKLLRTGRQALPEHPTIANDLAWFLATSTQSELRDGQEALGLAKQASAAMGDEDAGVLDTLAAAYAEAGHFAEAVSAAKQAVDLATQNGHAAQAERIAARLKLYETRQPYHEP